MKVIVDVCMTVPVEVNVDDKYKALIKDDNDMTWKDVDDLLDQALEEAQKQFPGVDSLKVEAVKTKRGKVLAEAL